MSKCVLLVGCGQLGSRHLQAMSILKGIDSIEILDPNPNSLALGQERLKEVEHLNPMIKMRWLSTLDQVNNGIDFCLIATQAQGRTTLIKDIVMHTGCRYFLIEKIVAQSMVDYEELIAFCIKFNVSVWVNCKARTYAIHQYVYSSLNHQVPLTMMVLAGNYGLGNNGIHQADLFAFYTKAKSIRLATAQIDQVVHPSKRGSDLCDLSGSLMGYSDNGSYLNIVFDRNHMNLECIIISDDKSRFIIDYASQGLCESRLENQWRMQLKDFTEDWRVSVMTSVFVEQILTEYKSTLPTLAQAAVAHQFILSSLQPHFNSLLKKDLSYCPVT